MCVALLVVGGESTNVYQRITEVVRGGTIIKWLYNNSEDFAGFFRCHCPFGPKYISATRQYRLAWIDWMIPQYETVGD